MNFYPRPLQKLARPRNWSTRDTTSSSATNVTTPSRQAASSAPRNFSAPQAFVHLSGFGSDCHARACVQDSDRRAETVTGP